MATEQPAEYWRHPGYSMVDHQLDPLMDVIRSWVIGWDGMQEPEWDRGPLAVEACKTALDALLVELDTLRKDRAYDAERKRLKDAGLPDPMLVSCSFCYAFEHEPCTTWTSDDKPTRFHKDRIRAAEEALS